MNRSVEQALTSLIPRHNGELPPELIELASSLLAQSRNKASNLKAEEEIGRTYACANIACERLKQSLNLPTIEPRPPCPPRIYANLYTYLLSALPRKRGRPRKYPTDPSTPVKLLPSRPSPTKAISLAPFQTTPRTRKHGLQFADSTKDVFSWITPVVRAMCNGLEAPGAIPHVLACVTSILTLPSPVAIAAGRNAGVEDKKNLVPALIVAAYFMVIPVLMGREIEGKEYVAQRKIALEKLRRIRADEEVGAKFGGNWDGWEEVGPRDVDGWLAEISSKGWLELDWFANVGEGVGLDALNGGVGDDDEEDNTAGAHDDKNVLQAGLGTMMQDKVDYLSERKRADYALWKEAILARIEAIEQITEDRMDTS